MLSKIKNIFKSNPSQEIKNNKKTPTEGKDEKTSPKNIDQGKDKKNLFGTKNQGYSTFNDE